MTTRANSGSAFTDHRRSKTARKYVTQCKICRQAIHEDEPRQWLASPMGLSHERCA